MKGPEFKEPYALFEMNGKRHVFCLETGWESEEYIVLEIQETGIREQLRTLIH
jgi:hypothetical protein